MMATTLHRGPDDSGDFVSDRWSLGHNRLAIIDLSANGHQPMETADGRYTIVFNGEIYNFKDIREELIALGDKFISRTDTEVILYAYARWKEMCVNKFNGMFAFAILDKESGEVFIARDRIGIKPLYYYSKNRKFIFSSEIKAILDHPVPRTLDIDALNLLMRVLYIPAPKTIWQDIYKLPPAHYMRVSAAGNVSLTKYWEIQKQPLLTDKAQILAETKRLLKDSVRLQLVSDRPVGIFLSGGIDSTIVTGIASSLSKNISTFSVGYEETEEASKYNNDKILARKTAEHFKTHHHEYKLSAKDVIDNIKKSIYHMDEPISNHVQSVNMLLAEHVAKDATVVLGGDGGDELFGGYERYYYNNLIEKFQRIPAWLRNSAVMKLMFSIAGKAQAYELFQTRAGVDRYLGFFAKKETLVRKILTTKYNRPAVTREYFNDLYFKNVENNFTCQFMRTDVYSWLPSESLVRSDKMSMAASIEQRVPFLDHRLVEFADRIPVNLKLGRKGLSVFSVGRKYKGKAILREAMAEYLPTHVLNAQKWGWFSPAAKWVRGPLLPLMKEVLSPDYNKGTAEVFDFPALQSMLDNHINKKTYALNELWAVMTFQLWYRKFMKR